MERILEFTLWVAAVIAIYYGLGNALLWLGDRLYQWRINRKYRRNKPYNRR